MCHGFPLRAQDHLPPFLTHMTMFPSLSQPTIHYHYQLHLLTGCISQQRHSMLACAVISTLQELAEQVYQYPWPGKMLAQWLQLTVINVEISELPFPGLIQSSGERQMSILFLKKNPTPSFWKQGVFITLDSSTEIGIFFFYSYPT